MTFKTADWRFTQCWKQQFVQPQRPCPKRHRYTTSTTETLPQKTQVYYFNHRDPAPKDTGILLQPQRPCPKKTQVYYFNHRDPAPKRHRYTTSTTETLPKKTQVYYFNHRDPAPKDTGILLQPQRPCPKRHRYTTSTTETLPQKTQVYYFNHRDPAPKDTGILLQPQRPCPKRHRYTTSTTETLPQKTGILLLLCWFHHMEKQATCLTARTETTPSELTLVTAAFARPASPMIWLTLACSVLLRGWKYSSLGTQNQMSSSQAWHFSYCTGWVAI